MRPRRSTGLPPAFTFGGRLPAVAGLLLALFVAGTLANWILGIGGLFALLPDLIVRGEVWRLVTWPFVQPRADIFGLFFGGLVLWQMGQQLPYLWGGEGRFLQRFLLFTLAASVGATLVSRVWPVAAAQHLGVWPVADALLLSWAMMNPGAQISLMMVLPVTGRTFALLLVAGTALYGVAVGGIPGLALMVPHFSALGAAWLLGTGRLPSGRRFRLGLRDWWLEQQLRRRSRHLKVVKKDGRNEPPRWLN